MVNSNAGGDASRAVVDEAPRMKVFRDRSVPDNQREKGDLRTPACVAKGIPIREAKNIPSAQAALDSEWKNSVGT